MTNNYKLTGGPSISFYRTTLSLYNNILGSDDFDSNAIYIVDPSGDNTTSRSYKHIYINGNMMYEDYIWGGSEESIGSLSTNFEINENAITNLYEHMYGWSNGVINQRTLMYPNFGDSDSTPNDNPTNIYEALRDISCNRLKYLESKMLNLIGNPDSDSNTFIPVIDNILNNIETNTESIDNIINGTNNSKYILIDSVDYLTFNEILKNSNPISDLNASRVNSISATNNIYNTVTVVLRNICRGNQLSIHNYTLNDDIEDHTYDIYNINSSYNIDYIEGNKDLTIICSKIGKIDYIDGNVIEIKDYIVFKRTNGIYYVYTTLNIPEEEIVLPQYE